MPDLSLLSIANKSLDVSPPFSVVKDVLGFVHSPPASLKHRLQMKGRMKRARRISLRSYFDLENPTQPELVSIRKKISQYEFLQHPFFGEQDLSALAMDFDDKSKISLQEVLNGNSLAILSLRNFFQLPQYGTFKGVSIREKIIQHLSAFSKIIDRKDTISLQKVLNKNFYILVFGDSIAWGQGLNTKDKFSHIVKNRIAAEYPSNDVFIKVFAQSGAPIKPNGNKKSGKGEIPSDLPTILQQVQDFKGSRKSVDLILLDGGINDIGALSIVFAMDGDTSIENACYKSMRGLLKLVIESYTNSLIVTTGYYPIVSNETTDLDKVLSILNASYALAEYSMLRSTESSRKFADESTKKFKLAVNETNSTLSLNRIYYANPDFEPKNSVMGSDPWLWGVTWNLQPEDPKRKYREKYCNSDIECKYASVFHPNKKGAKKYAQAIEKVLENAGLLTTAFATPLTSPVDAIGNAIAEALQGSLGVAITDAILNPTPSDSVGDAISSGLGGELSTALENSSLPISIPTSHLDSLDQNAIADALTVSAISDALLNPTSTDPVEGAISSAPGNSHTFALGTSITLESQDLDSLGNLLFVINMNKRHMEIHRRDCIFAGKIRAENKALITGDPKDVAALYLNGILPASIIDGLVAEGYDGCYHCLNQYHTK